MTMDRRTTPAAVLLLAASSLTVVSAADFGRWTSTPTRQMDDHQHVRTAPGDRVDARLGVAGIVVITIAPVSAGRTTSTSFRRSTAGVRRGVASWRAPADRDRDPAVLLSYSAPRRARSARPPCRVAAFVALDDSTAFRPRPKTVTAAQLPRQNFPTNDAPATANQTKKHEWSRIHIADPYLRDTAERMLDAAATALSRAECQMLMSDFVDGRGQPLSTKLTDLGVTARDYLTLIIFEDGTGRDACKRDGVLAITTPGSRVIYLCGHTFVRSAARDPKELMAVMIHEMLHSLGLGENPPKSRHITYRVKQRCWM